MNRAILTTLLLATVAIPCGSHAQQRDSAQRDMYGYTQYDSPKPKFCGFDYVPLDGVATNLTLIPGHPQAAVDDRAATLPLQQAFDLYGIPTSTLIVSGNGYLAAADSLAQEDGADFSNDCPLPAMPDNPTASNERIYVYHDDLRPRAGGTVRQAHFSTCPRPSETGATEVCTVVEWNGFERTGPSPSSTPLQMQAVLYHGSHEIVFQYLTVDDSQGASATIGLQGLDGYSAKIAGCNAPARIVPERAVCLFDRRYQRGTVAPGTVLD